MNFINVFKIEIMFKKILFLIALNLSTNVFSQSIPTRFGSLDISDENMLLYNGKHLSPEVEGNNSLSLVNSYRFGDKEDVILLRDNGGDVCPALYYFISLSSFGLKQAGAFGTCTDIIHVHKSANSISVSMHGFAEKTGSRADIMKILKEKHIFIYKDGLLTENGKQAKNQAAF